MKAFCPVCRRLGAMSVAVATLAAIWFALPAAAPAVVISPSALASAPAPEVPAVSAASQTRFVVITGSRVNVRSGAGTSHSRIGSVTRGKKFTLLATKKDASGRTWYQIPYQSSRKGWVISTLSRIQTETAPAQTTDKKTKKKVAYLTFDDGPSENTFKILDILDKYNVKATFFVIYHKNMKKQYQAIVERGHTIALHSYTHRYDKIYKSRKAYFDDLKKIHDYVQDVTGVDSRIIRFPGGSSNTVSNRYSRGIMKKLKADVREKGYLYHDWNVSSGDAGGNNRKVSVLLKNVKSGVGKKSTVNVLMHDTGKSKRTTVEALPSIISYLDSKGYTFEALTEDSKLIQHG